MSQFTDQIAAQIQTLVNDEGFLGTAHNDHLHQINDLLKSLPPAQADQVLSKLGSSDLNKWASEVDSGGIFGARGLSQGEKKDLFNLFARDLDGTQLARASNSFGNREDVISLGQSVAQYATPEAKVQYIQQLAGKTTGNTSDIHAGALSQTAFHGNAQAVAVGIVLASLKGNVQAIDRAVGSLTESQLQAVVQAAENQTLTHYTGDLSERPPSIQTDARPLQAVLSAVATSNDAATKARVFEAGVNGLTDIQDTNQPLMPNVGAAGDAERVQRGLTDILNSDARGVIDRLNTKDASGHALATYLKQVVTDNPSANNGIIGGQIAQLQGAGTGMTAKQFIGTAVRNGSSAPYYRNAENLGYYSGAVQAAIRSRTSDAKTQGDIVNNIFSTAINVATAPVELSPGGKIGVAAFIGVTSEVVRETVNSIAASNTKLQGAFSELALPRDAGSPDRYRGAADPFFQAAEEKVQVDNL